MEKSKVASEKLKQDVPTRVPRHSNTINPGLSPYNIEELQLINEYIALAEPITTRDYPSPEGDKLRYGGAN